MHKREAKSLLEQYPPIVEIIIPYNDSPHQVVEQAKDYIGNRMPKNTIVFLRHALSDELVFNYVNITTVLKDGHLMYNRVKRDIEELIKKHNATL